MKKLINKMKILKWPFLVLAILVMSGCITINQQNPQNTPSIVQPTNIQPTTIQPTNQPTNIQQTFPQPNITLIINPENYSKFINSTNKESASDIMETVYPIMTR